MAMRWASLRDEFEEASATSSTPCGAQATTASGWGDSPLGLAAGLAEHCSPGGDFRRVARALRFHSVHVTIGKTLGDAVRWALLAGSSPPRRPSKPARTERRIWGPDDLTAFVEATKADRLCPL